MNPSSFTTKGSGLLRVIATPVVIVNPQTKEKHQINAIWDTGATGSSITSKVAKQLGLIATGYSQVQTANGVAAQKTYTVEIGLPNSILVKGVTVTELEDLSGSDALIGMDIITLGDFSITNHHGNTCCSFRIPSCHEIDYVNTPNFGVAKIIKKPIMNGHKPNQNDKCPCGSGKKYKRCCGVTT